MARRAARTGRCRRTGRGTDSSWPGLDVPDSDLTIEEFVALSEQAPGREEAAGPTLEQVLDILRLAAIFLGIAPSTATGVASQVVAALGSGRRS